MPALQVRDFPDELYNELRLCAAEEHRSIAQQTIVAVRDYLANRGRSGHVPANAATPTHPRAFEADVLSTPSRERLVARHRDAWQRIHELPRFDVPEGFPSPAEILHEARDAR